MQELNDLRRRLLRFGVEIIPADSHAEPSPRHLEQQQYVQEHSNQPTMKYDATSLSLQELARTTAAKGPAQGQAASVSRQQLQEDIGQSLEELKQLLERCSRLECSQQGATLRGAGPQPSTNTSELASSTDEDALDEDMAACAVQQPYPSLHPAQQCTNSTRYQGTSARRKPAAPSLDCCAREPCPHMCRAAGSQKPFKPELHRGCWSTTRRSPLAVLLAQLKDSEAAWAEERARLRRYAAAQHKHSLHLQQELTKLQFLHKHQGSELKGLMRALKGRDAEIAQLHRRLESLQRDSAASANQATADLLPLQAERDQLKQGFEAALRQMETSQVAVHAQESTIAALQSQVDALQRDNAGMQRRSETALAGMEGLSRQTDSQEWRADVLEKVLDVQLQHNRQKAEALRQAIEQGRPGSEILRLSMDVTQSELSEGRTSREGATNVASSAC